MKALKTIVFRGKKTEKTSSKLQKKPKIPLKRLSDWRRKKITRCRVCAMRKKRG